MGWEGIHKGKVKRLFLFKKLRFGLIGHQFEQKTRGGNHSCISHLLQKLHLLLAEGVYLLEPFRVLLLHHPLQAVQVRHILLYLLEKATIALALALDALGQLGETPFEILKQLVGQEDGIAVFVIINVFHLYFHSIQQKIAIILQAVIVPITTSQRLYTANLNIDIIVIICLVSSAANTIFSLVFCFVFIKGKQRSQPRLEESSGCMSGIKNVGRKFLESIMSRESQDEISQN